MSSVLFGYDFYYLWTAGNVLRAGENPYELPMLGRRLALAGWPAEEVAQGLTHPPANLWLYWLFALLPLQLSLLLWVCVTAAVSLCCGIVTAVLLRPGKILSRPILLFATFTFPPFLSNIIWGQINVILLLGLTLYAYFMKQGSRFVAGLGCSLVLFKPHLFIPFLSVVFLYELKSLRFRLILGLLSGLLFQLLFSYCISPNSFEWYLAYLPSVVRESSQICGASVGQMVECEIGWSWIRPLVLVLGVCGGLVLTRLYGYSLSTLLVLVVPLSILVSPYAWSHTFIALLPAYLFIVTVLCSQLPQRLMVYIFTGVAVLSIPIIIDARIQYAWIGLPLLLLLLGMRVLQIPQNRCQPL